MRILYLCHRFPYPPRRGGKIRPFNMIRHLSRSHEVTVASLVRSEEEAEEARGIAPYCADFHMTRVRGPLQTARMLMRLPTATPSSLAYFHSLGMARTVQRLLAERRFDLIFVHCCFVAHYVANFRGAPKILDYGDMDSQKWRDYSRYVALPLSLGYWLEAAKLERVERRLSGCFDLCTATTRAEWASLQSCANGVATDWFPNGVDSEYFRPSDEPFDRDLISFVGRMDYYPNQECMIEFCRTTLPLLKARRPSLRLAIVGADPSSAIRRLGQIPGVTVTGSVPDVRPFLRRSALMIAPLNIARGTQNKILEAMAMGVPVVTSRTAAGGVDALDQKHFLVASSPQQYVEAILRIRDHPLERDRLARAGRERVLAHHDWDSSMRRLDAIIERCVFDAAARQAHALPRALQA